MDEECDCGITYTTAVLGPQVHEPYVPGLWCQRQKIPTTWVRRHTPEPSSLGLHRLASSGVRQDLLSSRDFAPHLQASSGLGPHMLTFNDLGLHMPVESHLLVSTYQRPSAQRSRSPWSTLRLAPKSSGHNVLERHLPESLQSFAPKSQILGSHLPQQSVYWPMASGHVLSEPVLPGQDVLWIMPECRVPRQASSWQMASRKVPLWQDSVGQLGPVLGPSGNIVSWQSNPGQDTMWQPTPRHAQPWHRAPSQPLSQDTLMDLPEAVLQSTRMAMVNESPTGTKPSLINSRLQRLTQTESSQLHMLVSDLLVKCVFDMDSEVPGPLDLNSAVPGLKAQPVVQDITITGSVGIDVEVRKERLPKSSLLGLLTSQSMIGYPQKKNPVMAYSEMRKPKLIRPMLTQHKTRAQEVANSYIDTPVVDPLGASQILKTPLRESVVIEPVKKVRSSKRVKCPELNALRPPMINQLKIQQVGTDTIVSKSVVKERMKWVKISAMLKPLVKDLEISKQVKKSAKVKHKRNSVVPRKILEEPVVIKKNVEEHLLPKEKFKKSTIHKKKVKESQVPKESMKETVMSKKNVKEFVMLEPLLKDLIVSKPLVKDSVWQKQMVKESVIPDVLVKDSVKTKSRVKDSSMFKSTTDVLMPVQSIRDLALPELKMEELRVPKTVEVTVVLEPRDRNSEVTEKLVVLESLPIGAAVQKPVVNSIAPQTLGIDFVVQNKLLSDALMPQSSVTDAVVTQPLVTDAVITQPLVTDVVVTQPLVTDAVITQPLVTDGVVTQPSVTDAVVTQPSVTEAVVMQPSLTNLVPQLEFRDVGMLHSEVMDALVLTVTDITLSPPKVTDLALSQSDMSQLAVIDSMVPEIAVKDSVVLEPLVTDSVALEPAAKDFAVPDPSLIDLAVPEPALTVIAVPESGVTEMVITDLGMPQPVVADLLVQASASADLLTSEPAATDPPVPEVAALDLIVPGSFGNDCMVPKQVATDLVMPSMRDPVVPEPVVRNSIPEPEVRDMMVPEFTIMDSLMKVSDGTDSYISLPPGEQPVSVPLETNSMVSALEERDVVDPDSDLTNLSVPKSSKEMLFCSVLTGAYLPCTSPRDPGGRMQTMTESMAERNIMGDQIELTLECQPREMENGLELELAAQQQLKLLLHARDCRENDQCTVAHCKKMRIVVQHMTLCQESKSCPVPNCVSSRGLISHWDKCKVHHCPLCAPLRWYQPPANSCPTSGPPSAVPHHPHASSVTSSLYELFPSSNESAPLVSSVYPRRQSGVEENDCCNVPVQYPTEEALKNCMGPKEVPQLPDAMHIQQMVHNISLLFDAKCQQQGQEALTECYLEHSSMMNNLHKSCNNNNLSTCSVCECSRERCREVFVTNAVLKEQQADHHRMPQNVTFGEPWEEVLGTNALFLISPELQEQLPQDHSFATERLCNEMYRMKRIASREISDYMLRANHTSLENNTGLPGISWLSFGQSLEQLTETNIAAPGQLWNQIPTARIPTVEPLHQVTETISAQERLDLLTAVNLIKSGETWDHLSGVDLVGNTEPWGHIETSMTASGEPWDWLPETSSVLGQLKPDKPPLQEKRFGRFSQTQKARRL